MAITGSSWLLRCLCPFFIRKNCFEWLYGTLFSYYRSIIFQIMYSSHFSCKTLGLIRANPLDFRASIKQWKKRFGQQISAPPPPPNETQPVCLYDYSHRIEMGMYHRVITLWDVRIYRGFGVGWANQLCNCYILQSEWGRGGGGVEITLFGKSLIFVTQYIFNLIRTNKPYEIPYSKEKLTEYGSDCFRLFCFC